MELIVENVSHRYGDVVALEEIDLAVRDAVIGIVVGHAGLHGAVPGKSRRHNAGRLRGLGRVLFFRRRSGGWLGRMSAWRIWMCSNSPARIDPVKVQCVR